MNGACNVIFFGPAPLALGRGQKVKYHYISITTSISKIFIPNFVCVLANERYKTHTGQCKRTGGCYNELVVAFFSTGGGVKGKKIYTC